MALSLEREEVPPTKKTVLDALRSVASQGDWPDVIHTVDLSVQTKREDGASRCCEFGKSENFMRCFSIIKTLLRFHLGDGKPAHALNKLAYASNQDHFMFSHNKRQTGAGAAFVLALGLSVIATPSLAQRSEVDGERARALQECNQAAAKYPQNTWGHQQLDIYRSCMANHGQPE
jgi:hypothetical protein